MSVSPLLRSTLSIATTGRPIKQALANIQSPLEQEATASLHCSCLVPYQAGHVLRESMSSRLGMYVLSPSFDIADRYVKAAGY